MAHVLLSNGVKVWVGNCQGDTTLNELISSLNDIKRYDGRIKACRTLGSIGLLAKEAIPSLEAIVHLGSDTNLINAALDALERIFPDKYHPSNKVCYRSAAADRLKKMGGYTNEIGPVQKKKKEENIPSVINKVDLVQKDTVSLEEEIRITKKCNFCEKETPVENDNKRILEKLSSPKKFYCNFCLRHQYNMKDSRHIMIISFRSIIGYFYYEFYQFPKTPTMWMSEIRDYHDLHVEVGKRNPVFCYDIESMNWFIDFRRVGESKKKIPISDVNSTIIEILASFNLSQVARGIQMHKLYEKYEEAVMDFYQKRYRPEGKRICIPTLQGCGIPEWSGGVVVNPHTHNTNKLALSDTKNFNPNLISCEKFWSKTGNL